MSWMSAGSTPARWVKAKAGPAGDREVKVAGDKRVGGGRYRVQ
jgi:hypothetical protein